MKNKLQAILFDLDGTLWDSSEGVLGAWNQVIAEHKECQRGPLTQEELNGYFGLPMTQIAQKMFDRLTLEEQQKMMDACCQVENAYLREHGGILFPKLEETLSILHEQYQLFIVSNCQQGYIESFLAAHHMESYFDDIQCWGDNQVPKGENNKVIMQRNHISQAVYVGDTAGDEESARVAGIPFIYAAYGFGEANAPDAVISSLTELPEVAAKFFE